MCVAQGVSPGTTTHRPPPAVYCRQRQRHTAGGDSGANDPWADAQGYTHAAPLGLKPYPELTLFKDVDYS